MKLRRLLPLWLITLLAAMLLASCGSSLGPMRAGARHGRGKYPSPATFSIPATADAPTRKLLTEARSWLGTSYKYGGTDANGVDCSGFVLSVYNRALSIKLPRNSARQQEYCVPIDRSSLTEGDLVFFTTRGSRGVGHVGIYIGNGMMIHSSSSKGVIISSLDQPYYADNYYSSGRVEKFFAMKQDSRRKAQPAPAEPAKPEEVLIAKASTAPEIQPLPQQPQPQQSQQQPQHTVRTSRVTPPPATAATMESDKQKALNSLLMQIEDSIFATK